MSLEPLSLPALRQLVADGARASLTGEKAGRIGLGADSLDADLGGGIERGALHEIHAAGDADLAAATGFAVGLALRAGDGPILWARQDFLDAETGILHAPGLAELGLSPDRIVLVRARDAQGVLRAGAEAARCGALRALVIEPWGEPKILDLTASRRLALAAETSGVLTLLLRAAARPSPSAARTRWQVGALPSQALEANAPGHPAFRLRLLRNRGGLDQREWRVEWDRDRQCFQERTAFSEDQHPAIRPDASPHASPHVTPLSRPVVPLPGERQAEAPLRRRAG